MSHLSEHKLKHNFQDSLNPICNCGKDIETSAHFLLHCPNCSNERSTFLNIIKTTDRRAETLPYGDSNSNNITTVDSRKIELSGDQKISLSYREFEFSRNGLKTMKITGLLS